MKAKYVIGMILVGVLVLGVVPGYSMYVGNYSGKSFDASQVQAGDESASAFTIEELVVKSAVFFLRGKSRVDLLASELEGADLEGKDSTGYRKIVTEALDNMVIARSYYLALMNQADKTPYNQKIILQLTTFKYHSFFKKKRMNGDISLEVQGYLEAGNVRGAYERLYGFTDNIVSILEKIREQVVNREFPDTENIWRLNQECAHMLLFGQYMAQTFKNLR
ncbi:MAG: hypothetical protein GY765_04335 [bacterium]|nr:hypothetical protein [bacterium]